MELQQQPNFLTALKYVLADGISAVTLSTQELFFIANDLCPPQERIRYGTYLRFLHSLNEYGEPTEQQQQNAVLLDINDCLNAQEARQKMALLEAISKGEKDWRRFVWLLQYRPKMERQQLAQAKQREREQKEEQKTAETTAKLQAPAALGPQPLAPAKPEAAPALQHTDTNAMYFKKTG